MLYTDFGSHRFSRLSLGTAPFGTAISRDTAFEIMDKYLDMGGNLLDTAAVYGFGTSEKTIGEWMTSRGTRHRVFISTKGGHPAMPSWEKRITEADIRADMEASLRHLNADYTDIYFLHRDDEDLPVSEIMPILDRFVRSCGTGRAGVILVPGHAVAGGNIGLILAAAAGKQAAKQSSAKAHKQQPSHFPTSLHTMMPPCAPRWPLVTR